MTDGPTLREILGIWSKPLARQLEEVVQALRQTGTAKLPALPEPQLWAKLLYREALRSGPWFPYLHLEASHCPKAPDLSTVEGGWLSLAADWTEPVPEGNFAVLRQGKTPPAEAPLPALMARLTHLDRHHLVATDPTLRRERAAMLAHCRQGELVLVSGPLGSGRSALCKWAHSVLMNAPMQSHEVPGQTNLPGHWHLIPDIEDRSPEQLQTLQERLSQEEAVYPHIGRQQARPSHPDLKRLVGQNAAFVDVLIRAHKHAQKPYSVLLLGESGTGKEPLARAIHDMSQRAGPFVVVDLSSRSEALVADDLFGHERGAFDGASRPRLGAARKANKGTLFLDELGNLSLTLQARLLRLLDQGGVQPLGSDQVTPLDLRIIAATNADIPAMVRSGEFRLDLFHRLNAVTLRLPPLRTRLDDLEPLALHFLREAGVRRPSISADALTVLGSYAWPGNIRELRNQMQVIATESEGQTIQPAHLSQSAGTGQLPILVTVRPGESPASSLLNRRQSQQLRSITIHTRAPTDRSPLGIRNAVLGSLGGRPITREALHLLEHSPWWGNYTELHRKLSLVRETAPGPVNVETLSRLFPELEDQGQPDAITIVLNPSVDSKGRLKGMRSTFHAASVLVGRASSISDLGDHAASERDQQRWVWLKQHQVQHADLLSLPFLPSLSRAHILVTRGPSGLLAQRIPGAPSAVKAGPIGALQPADRPVALGDAGELHVLRKDGSPGLRLAVFLGAAAMEQSLGLLTPGPAAHEETKRESVRRRLWTLNPEECATLNHIVADYEHSDTDFANHLARSLGRILGPSALRDYLLSSHPTQSCGRLYKHAGNSLLREGLRTVLGDRPGLLKVLPRPLRLASEQP
jgi:transcriptional regulator with AAA-type ATPase domain